MKMNRKLFIGITIVLYSIFGFAGNAGSPHMKETSNFPQISETTNE
ncbi:hypothetical protein P8610_05295 [Fictibacillus sp. UD]